MPVLGLNAYHGDASAALVGPDGLLAAVEEERFTRTKHWAGFPHQAIGYCAGFTNGAGEGSAPERDPDLVVAVGREPGAYFFRKAALALTHPKSLGRALARVKNLAAINRLSERLANAAPDLTPDTYVYPVEHHLTHSGRCASRPR